MESKESSLGNKKKYYYYYGDYYFLNKNFLWDCGKARGNFPSAKVAFIKLLRRYHKTFINWNSTKLNSFFFSPTFSPVITALIYLPNWWDLAVKNKQLKMWEIKFSEFHRGSSEGKSMKRVDLPGLAGCIINCLFSVTVT